MGQINLYVNTAQESIIGPHPSKIRYKKFIRRKKIKRILEN